MILEREVELPLPQEEVFRFFSDAANLAVITPPELQFQIVTPLPIDMRRGALIDYRLGLFLVRFAWRTEIVEWDPPQRFVDVQLKGPYRKWVHTHEFVPTPHGTRMRDHVEYELPFAAFGKLGLPIVRMQLKRIFDYRARAIERILLGQAKIKGAAHAVGH